MTMPTRCMNKNNIRIPVLGQNWLRIFTSYYCLLLPLYPIYLLIHYLPQRHHSPHLSLPVFPSLPAVPPLGLMNDLAGGGSCGCGGASQAQRGEETLFLSPPSYYSHSPGSSATQPCQEQDGTSLLDYLLK